MSSPARRRRAPTSLRRGPLRIERIVSCGQAPPPGFWYDQDEGEWVLVLRGRAGLEIEGRDGIFEMGPGDYAETGADTMPSDTGVIASALFLPYWFWGALCGAFSVTVVALAIKAYWR